LCWGDSMKKQTDAPEVEGDGKGNASQYEVLLDELIEQGVIADGGQLSKDGGANALQAPPTRLTNAQILISIPDIDKLYKESPEKALILDLMNRTHFRTQREFTLFNNWVNWCDSFTGEYDECLRYLAGIVSIGGLSREEYSSAISVYYNLRKNANNNNNNGYKSAAKFQDGKLS